jgi:UDP-N-acetylglucosamine transferase subunit ALG13
MIFVTTGTQKPFDRFIKAVDQIAHELSGVEFIVQALPSNYKPSNIEVLNFISPDDFDNYIKSSELIVSHAGMGTIISALVNNKPIIIMPRLLKFKEQRNEHQLATAKKLNEMGYIHVAFNEEELIAKTLNMWPDKLKALHNIGNVASQGLIDSINEMIR